MDAAITRLTGLKELDMWGCHQSTITDEGMGCLRRLERLTLFGCTQLTDNALLRLSKLRQLRVFGREICISDRALQALPNLSDLWISDLASSIITNTGLRTLTNLTKLRLHGCCNDAIGDDVFSGMGRLVELDLSSLRQSAITDGAFTRLTRLRSLSLFGYQGASIRGSTLTHLTNLTTLGLPRGGQLAVGQAELMEALPKLKYLSYYCSQVKHPDDSGMEPTGIRTHTRSGRGVADFDIPPALPGQPTGMLRSLVRLLNAPRRIHECRGTGAAGHNRQSRERCRRDKCGTGGIDAAHRPAGGVRFEPAGVLSGSTVAVCNKLRVWKFKLEP